MYKRPLKVNKKSFFTPLEEHIDSIRLFFFGGTKTGIIIFTRQQLKKITMIDLKIKMAAKIQILQPYSRKIYKTLLCLISNLNLYPKQAHEPICHCKKFNQMAAKYCLLTKITNIVTYAVCKLIMIQ